jgi:hypothetical protein
MEDRELFGTKYPISKHGKQCLGPCYEPGTTILHPISLDYLTHTKNAFCATPEWVYEDPKTGQKTNVLIDFCMGPTKKEDIGQEDIEMNILVPQFVFSCDFFLKMYYKIYSFDEAIKWINEKEATPLFTRMRILECALQNWGSTDQFVVTDDLLNIFTTIIKKRWIKDIYQEFSKYIIIVDGKISFGEPMTTETTNTQENHTVEKMNFLLKKILDMNILFTVISKYHDQNISKWNTIKSQLTKIKQFMIDYLEKKLLKNI